jgi:hypothetical protein
MTLQGFCLNGKTAPVGQKMQPVFMFVAQLLKVLR